MAKITVEELFYGDKYGIMGEVVKQVFARQDEFVADPHTFRELEIVRQTLIAVEKMKKNGDCIAEGELGDAGISASQSRDQCMLSHVISACSVT